MTKKARDPILWPEPDLVQLDDGTMFDAATDIRVLTNRSESFRFAADVVVDCSFSEHYAIPNVNADLSAIGAGSCKWPDISFAVGNLYRHHIELLLKALIVLGKRLGGMTSEFPHTHDLMELWEEARRPVATFPHMGDEAEMRAMEKRLADLAHIEMETQEFRYPQSGAGWDKPLPGREELRNLFKPLGDYLSRCVRIMWQERHKQRLNEPDTGGRL